MKATLSFPLVAMCLPLIYGARIDTSDGGYQDIVVAIHPSVPPDETIITNIKALFREASLFLHRATRGRVFFKDVTIAVPSTWPQRPQAQVTGSSLFNAADLRVAEPNPEYGDTPYTLQPRGCGEIGEYIHITPAFLSGLNDSTARTYGSPGAEPLRLCFRLFDSGTESNSCYIALFGSDTESNRAIFDLLFENYEYSHTQYCKTIKACTKCTNARYRTGQKPLAPTSKFTSGIPHKFRSRKDHSPAFENLPSSSDFVLRIMSRLPQYMLHDNSQFEQSFSEEAVDVRAVIILACIKIDFNRLVRLKSAATHFIRHIIPDDLELGVVVFNSIASTIRKLTPVNDTARAAMDQDIAALTASGGTCIGCALQRSIEVLKDGGRTAEGDTIILMTDGEENERPNIADVLPRLLSEKVVVNTLALGTSAEKTLENLALKTGGKAFSLQDDQKNIEAAMESAFVESTTTMLDDSHRPITILDESIKVAASRAFPFLIDQELGNDTKVIIMSSGPDRLDVQLWDPTGNPWSKTDSPSVGSGSRWLTLEIPSPAMPGTWNLTLTKTTSAEVVVNVRVTSMAKIANDQPIRLRTFLKRLDVNVALDACIYSEVSKGPHAVLRAKVQARVMTPLENVGQLTVELFDDGVGADVTANDGIYSAYFTQFNGAGRYSVVAEVTGGGSAIIVRGRRGSGGLPVVTSSPELSTQNSAIEEATSASPAFDAEGLPFDQFIYVDEDIEVAEPRATEGEEAPSFRRFADGGSFRVNNTIEVSRIPPGSIQDLQVADVIRDNGTFRVVLSWTCPGEHLDFGQASQMEIRVSTDMASLLERFDEAFLIRESDVVEGQLSPSPARTKQNVTVKIPEDVVSEANNASRTDFYFAARVLNNDSISSGASNIALATFEHPPLGQVPPASRNLGLIIGVTVAAIFLVAIILAVLFGRHRTPAHRPQPGITLPRLPYS
ncbi:unnamed protein product [Ixodes hexagonus]